MRRTQKTHAAPLRTDPIGDIPTSGRSRLLVAVNEWPGGSTRVSLSYFILTSAGAWVPNGKRLSFPIGAARHVAALIREAAEEEV
jgi:hypothetical protein